MSHFLQEARYIFHSLMVHGSGPNATPNPRNTALYAYFLTPGPIRTERWKAGGENISLLSLGLDGKTELTLVAQT